VPKGVGTLNTHLARSIVVVAAMAWALALAACSGGSATTNVGDGAVGTRVEVEGGAYFDITPRTLKS
jgi:hypothetical protein